MRDDGAGSVLDRYVSLLFVLGPVLAVSFAALFASQGLSLQAAVFWSVGALFVGLCVFGRNVWRPTARLFEEERRAAMAKGGS